MQNNLIEFDITIAPHNVRKGTFKDLFRYRELFYFLSWRDILVRYKQAFFGIAWAIFRPVLNMILFTFLFHRIAAFNSGDIDYSLFVLAGMLPWQLFSSAVVDSSNCLLNNAHLISKVYFPRIILPASQMMIHLLDFVVGSTFLFLLMLITATPVGWSFFYFPLCTLLLLTFSLGLALFLSAITMQYRDVRFIIPFVIQFGVFLSPVGYTSVVIPGKWQWLYSLNPMVGIINGFRWSLFGIEQPFLIPSVLISVVIAIFTLAFGLHYFRKTENTFADRL